MLVLRSVLASVLLALWAGVISVLGQLTWPLPPPWRYAFVSLFARGGLLMLRNICGLDFTVEGREHIPDQASVVMAKHQSAWETMAFQLIFPRQVWVLKRELLWVPFVGWGLALLKPIAIDRKAGRRAIEQVVDQGRARLHEGWWVIVFPEGTRVAAGTKGQYHRGGAVLAQRAGCVVVPVAHNAGEFWGRQQIIKRPGTIRVVIGPPIATQDRRSADITAEAEHWIESTMARISTLPYPNPKGGAEKHGNS